MTENMYDDSNFTTYFESCAKVEVVEELGDPKHFYLEDIIEITDFTHEYAATTEVRIFSFLSLQLKQLAGHLLLPGCQCSF